MTLLESFRAPEGAGPLCLQGGAEFGRACQGMDQIVVSRSPMGTVVVVPAAAPSGGEYLAAGRNATRYYSRWVGDQGRIAPDPREDLDGFLEVVALAALLVLPGGSPGRLVTALQGPAGDALVARWRAGAGLSGASAGAMLLCDQVVLPDAGGELTSGLGLVPGVALPHYDGEDRWADRLPADLPRWGLPECGGILVHGAAIRAVGAGHAVCIENGQAVAVPR